MKFRDFHRHFLSETARVFSDLGSSKEVLYHLDYPEDQVEWSKNARSFWSTTAKNLADGIVPGKDLCSLLSALRALRPGNKVFERQSVCDPPGTNPNPIHRAIERKLREFQGQLDFPTLSLRPSLHPGGELVDEWFYAWLTGSGPAGAFLLSKLGSGKTHATALLVEQARLRAAREGRDLGPVIWLRLREVDLIGSDPDAGFERYFKEKSPFSIWHSVPPISCLILDGLDEAWLRYPEERVFSWLGTVLDRARECEPRPNVLITGRDIVLRPLLHGRQLLTYLGEYLGITVRPNGLVETFEPEVLTLADYHDPTLRAMLRESLAHDPMFQVETVEALVAKIQPGLLSSPLLFGFADELLHLLLAEPRGDEIRPLSNEWELTDAWILRVLDREPRPRLPPFADPRTRLEAAENIALCLMLTGEGSNGLPLARLRREMEDLDLPPLDPVLLDDDERELRQRTLMKHSAGDRIALFHEVLLTHLAARALERLTSNGGFTEGAPPPGSSGSEGLTHTKSWTSHPNDPSEPGRGTNESPELPRVPPDRWSVELSRRLEWPRLPRTLSILQRARKPRAQDPGEIAEPGTSKDTREPREQETSTACEPQVWVKGSLPRSVLTYWIGQGPSWQAIDTFSLPRLDWAERDPTDDDALLLALQSILDDHNLTGRTRYETQSLDLLTNEVTSTSHPWPPDPGDLETSLDSDARWLAIPNGRFPVWRVRQGRRVAERAEIPPGIFLYRNLVTVAEFAEFLSKTQEPLPRDGDWNRWPKSREIVGWKRTGHRVYFRPELAELPVVGIDRDQAERYSHWLSQTQRTNGGRFTLPNREWLQIAVWGDEVGEPRAARRGPFGHHDLIGRRWQWTAADSEKACAFGGSRGLGSDASSIHATLVRGWPDLCWVIEPTTRHPDIGFRLAFVSDAERISKLGTQPREAS